MLLEVPVMVEIMMMLEVEDDDHVVVRWIDCIISLSEPTDKK